MRPATAGRGWPGLLDDLAGLSSMDITSDGLPCVCQHDVLFI